MGKTKQKIVDTALNLFNEQGLARVTLRTIAGEMGISQGNLNYHFRKRADIVETLYHQLVGEMDEQMQALAIKTADLSALFTISRSSMQVFFRYRFLMLDFVQVMREHPPIRNHYQQLQVLRRQQFQQIFAALQENGIIRPPEFPGEYERLYTRLHLMGDSWISFAEIQDDTPEAERVDAFASLLFEALYPYVMPEHRGVFGG